MDISIIYDNMITHDEILKITLEDLNVIHNYIHRLYNSDHRNTIRMNNKRSYNKNKPIKEENNIKINPLNISRL